MAGGIFWEEYTDGEVLDFVMKELGVEDTTDISGLFAQIKILKQHNNNVKTYDVSIDYNSAMVSIEASSEEDAIEQVKQVLYKDPEAYNDLMEGINVGEYVECQKEKVNALN